MKTLIALLVLVCAVSVGVGQQPTASPAPSVVQRPVYRHRIGRRRAMPPPSTATAKTEAPPEYLIGDAKVDVTKDETVVRLAMAQHASVFIELPANDGPRYIIPGDPEMATVDEKALERNKRAIVVRPGTLFLPPSANHKARTPAATVTAQMRSGLVVTFLFYPVRDLAQNVHRCVLSYNRDEVVARRRAAGLPVNLDNNSTNDERRDSTGQSTVRTSISVDTTDEDKTQGKPATSEPKEKADVNRVSTSVPVSVPAKVKPAAEADERAKLLVKDALANAVKKPKQFKKWTKPIHELALSVLPQPDPRHEFQLIVVGVKNIGNDNLKLISGAPELVVEMLDDSGKPINLESVKKVYIESTSPTGDIAGRSTAYYALVYAAPVLTVHQRLKIIVTQTNAADEPASLALVSGK